MSNLLYSTEEQVSYSTYFNDCRFSIEIGSYRYDLSEVSELFPDLIHQIVDYLDGFEKVERHDN